MALAGSLPIVLQSALSSLESFLSSHAVLYGRSGDNNKAMRSDRLKSLLAVVTVLLRGCCLQHEGTFCHISTLWARPLSLAEIACMAGVCSKTVSRCFDDLINLGFLESSQIKRRNPKTGKFEVSVGLRHFTEKFWAALGLLADYKKAVKWAKENAKRRLIVPFKTVSKKIKSAGVSTKYILKPVLAALDSDHMRVKQQCSKILAMLRPRK